MNSDFIQNTRGRGEIGKQWLQDLPNFIKEIEEIWKIKVLRPFYLSFNYVALVKQSDGSKAVLKLVFPNDKEFQTEAEALKLYNGKGAIKLLNKDYDRRALLLEFIQPGLPLSSIGDEEKMTIILSEMMKKLWRNPSRDNNFPHIKDWVKGIRRYKNKFGTKGLFPSVLIEKADEFFEELIGTTKEDVVCHGDLHHYNIISAKKGTLASN